MRTSIKPRALYWATFNHFELRLKGQAVLDIAQSGDNEPAVKRWAPAVREQVQLDNFPNKPTAEKIALELVEYGAWDDDDLKDEAKNWERLVWIAAHNIAEEENPDCSPPVT